MSVRIFLVRGVHNFRFWGGWVGHKKSEHYKFVGESLEYRIEY